MLVPGYPLDGCRLNFRLLLKRGILRKFRIMLQEALLSFFFFLFLVKPNVFYLEDNLFFLLFCSNSSFCNDGGFDNS